MMSY